MKNLIYKLAILLFTAGFLWVPEGFSQQFKQDRKLTKKEMKESRKAMLFSNFQVIEMLLESKSFVLEAEFLKNKHGVPIPVTSRLNFIEVDTPRVVLQTGTSNHPAFNGVGGVTAEGKISRWEVKKDPEKLSYTVVFTTTTDLGSYEIIMTVEADATATATITGETRGSLTYRGNLVAAYNSKVIKGQRSL